MWATQLSSHSSILREQRDSWRILQNASLLTALTAVQEILTWEGSTRLLLLTRALLSVPQHQTSLSCQHPGAKAQENSKPLQPHTEQLTSTNRTARQCSGKSVCMLQNSQNGCVYPSHCRFLPETKQQRPEMWNVNEVWEGAGLIQAKSVTHPCQSPERPGEKQAWWLKERKPEDDQNLKCKWQNCLSYTASTVCSYLC